MRKIGYVRTKRKTGDIRQTRDWRRETGDMRWLETGDVRKWTGDVRKGT